MASPLQQASVRRKLIYVALVIALFTLSIFWRGKLEVPFSGQVGVARSLSNLSVLSQAKRLELRELDQGDPEVAGTAARLGLVGVRGVFITALWWSAIEKQKRNEFGEFELLVRAVTKLQPNFITPWLFQSWNIAYNVSVENDRLGDMYFYIARGIELLAEGDRVNTKTYYDPATGEARKVGSPEIRHQIGFYYQNKFSVSDKVSTLRSLMQVSCIKPADRRRSTLLTQDRGVDMAEFRKFCEANPQLVRRLRAKLNCDRPEEIVQFLLDNEKVPTLYKNDTELADPLSQFPVLPEPFPEGPDEYYPGKPVDDTFDAFHAARAWFYYSLPIVPPAKVDANNEPLPWSAPAEDEYDRGRYRMPRSPTLIIFRGFGPRAQTSLAERLAKEGWFDANSAWYADEQANTNSAWFPTAGAPVLLKTRGGSQEEWQKAAALWTLHGEQNGLLLSETRRNALYEAANGRNAGRPGDLPAEMSVEDLRARGLAFDRATATQALAYLERNQSLTQFPTFLATARAEADPLTVQARKLLWEADQARQNGLAVSATDKYRVALAYWRQVLTNFPDFHRAGQDRTEEDTYEYELKLIQLLKDDGSVRERARQLATQSGALLGAMAAANGAATEEDYRQAIAEEEAGLQVAVESIVSADPLLKPQPGDARDKARQRAGLARQPLGGLLGGLAQSGDQERALVREAVRATAPWLGEFKFEPKERQPDGTYERSAYWVSPSVREQVKTRLNLVRRAPVASATPPVAGEQQRGNVLGEQRPDGR